MRFSLVMATVGRRREVERFIRSLTFQKHTDFELIVMDQNRDDRLNKILSKYEKEIDIIHISCERGLSKARNRGMRYATGDILAFPDDDCWYTSDLLCKVNSFFNSNPNYAGLTGMARDSAGNPCGARWLTRPVVLNMQNVWCAALSFSIFLRRSMCLKIGGFDESLGAGANSPWQSGEETDYLIRCIKKRYHIQYNPDIYVHHPKTQGEGSYQEFERLKTYGPGMGRVLKKHNYPVIFSLYMCFRSFGGAIKNLFLLHPKEAFSKFVVFIERFRGLCSKE